MSGDPTETARTSVTNVLDAHHCEWLDEELAYYETAGLLDKLTQAGFAVVRADLPHGTELENIGFWQNRPTYCVREVSS